MPDSDKTPKEEFQDLLDKVYEQISIIDKKVPWQETEPSWWLIMTDFQRRIQYTKELLK